MLPEDLQLPKYPVVMQLDANYDKIVVIPDVHGCYDELMELLELPAVKSALAQEHALIFLGDLTDKGPESNKCVDFVHERYKSGKCFCVQSNHDSKYPRYTQHKLRGGKNPMTVSEAFVRIQEELTEDQLLWMSKLPAAILWQDFLFVHAGVIEGKMFNQPLQGFIRNRYLKFEDDHYHPVSTWKDSMGVWQHPKDAIHWTEAYKGDLRVVYGHEPLQDVKIYGNTFGIDTSAVFGNKLTAMIIDTKTRDITFESVPAKRSYAT